MKTFLLTGAPPAVMRWFEECKDVKFKPVSEGKIRVIGPGIDCSVSLTVPRVFIGVMDDKKFKSFRQFVGKRGSFYIDE